MSSNVSDFTFKLKTVTNIFLVAKCFMRPMRI